MCFVAALGYAFESLVIRKGKFVDNIALTHYFNIFNGFVFPMWRNFPQWKRVNAVDILIFTGQALSANMAQAFFSRAIQVG